MARGVGGHWAPAPAPCWPWTDSPFLFLPQFPCSHPALLIPDHPPQQCCGEKKKKKKELSNKTGGFLLISCSPVVGLRWKMKARFGIPRPVPATAPSPTPCTSACGFADLPGSTAVAGGQADRAKLQHKHGPLIQIHLSRAGPRVQGVSTGLGTGTASLLPPAAKRTCLLGDSCLSFPICKAWVGVLGVHTQDGWHVPGRAAQPRADSDLFTYGRTFCSTYLTPHLSVCLKPGTFPFDQAGRARRYVCPRDRPLVCASPPLRLGGIRTLSLRYHCKIHPEKLPRFSLPPSPHPSQAARSSSQGQAAPGSRKVTLFCPGRPSASQLPGSVAASVMHVCIC